MSGAAQPDAPELTVQVNLCPGDVAYAEATVPRLIRAHPSASHRLAVVDRCRPQTTRIFDAEARLPAREFSERSERILAMADDWRMKGLFDQVVELTAESPLYPRLAARYTRSWMQETHDYGGCAHMAYWAALDLPSTRFVVHYDADMLLHQDPGYDWAVAAMNCWERLPRVVAACPRSSPPGFAADAGEDGPTRHEVLALERVEAGWLNAWFSTRCFLFDRRRLAEALPLVGAVASLGLRLRRWLDRGYPPSPEILLFRSLGRQGWKRLNLADERAWILHPQRKSADYLALLPRILEAVASGRVPEAQRGHSEIDLPAWKAFVG